MHTSTNYSPCVVVVQLVYLIITEIVENCFIDYCDEMVYCCFICIFYDRTEIGLTEVSFSNATNKFEEKL